MDLVKSAFRTCRYDIIENLKSDSISNVDGFVPAFDVNHTNSATLIRDKSIEFLERMTEPENSKTPFFLYLPFQNIHGPYTVAEEYFNEYNNTTINDKQRTMFAYITEMDNALGHILNKLKETGQYNNTWIFATSDNGAPNAPQVEGMLCSCCLFTMIRLSRIVMVHIVNVFVIIRFDILF